MKNNKYDEVDEQVPKQTQDQQPGDRGRDGACAHLR